MFCQRFRATPSFSAFHTKSQGFYGKYKITRTLKRFVEGTKQMELKHFVRIQNSQNSKTLYGRYKTDRALGLYMEDTKQIEDFVWKVQNKQNSKSLYGRYKTDRTLRLCMEDSKQIEL